MLVHRQCVTVEAGCEGDESKHSAVRDSNDRMRADDLFQPHMPRAEESKISLAQVFMNERQIFLFLVDIASSRL
jgi:hypothetical protein